MSSNNSQNQVTEFADIAEELAIALQSGKSVIPFAEKRTPYGWLPKEKSATFIDLSNYQSIEDYSPNDQIITVQCGIKLYALEQFLLQKNQCLPFSYSSEETSLLDLILTGNAGPTETFAGGIRRHVLGLTSILSNGIITRSGGKVVKNVSGYDLTRFLIGSYGYFALPVIANLRLLSVPAQKTTIFISHKDFVSLFQFAQSILYMDMSFLYMDLMDQRLICEQLRNLLIKTTSVPIEDYCLFFQINGDQDIVSAEIDAIKKLLDDRSLQYAIFAELNDQHELILSLNRIDACLHIRSHYQHTLETAVTKGNFRELVQQQNFAFPFLYRMSSGKLSYFFNSPDERNHLLDSLNKYVDDQNNSLMVTYPDDLHMRKVEHLGKNDTDGRDVIRTIKKRLKNQFDPHNLFNPYVDI